MPKARKHCAVCTTTLFTPGLATKHCKRSRDGGCPLELAWSKLTEEEQQSVLALKKSDAEQHSACRRFTWTRAVARCEEIVRERERSRLAERFAKQTASTAAVPRTRSSGGAAQVGGDACGEKSFRNGQLVWRKLPLRRPQPQQLAFVKLGLKHEVKLLRAAAATGAMPVLRAFSVEEQPLFLVMEYISEFTLDTVLQAKHAESPLLLPAMQVTLANSLANALLSVYNLSFFHNDLTLRNVMVRREAWVAVLIDPSPHVVKEDMHQIFALLDLLLPAGERRAQVAAAKRGWDEEAALEAAVAATKNPNVLALEKVVALLALSGPEFVRRGGSVMAPEALEGPHAVLLS